MDHTTLSRMLKGERTMQIEDARQIADTLGVGLGEVLSHAGIQAKDPKKLRITGSVGSAGDVVIQESQRLVEVPNDLPSQSFVIRGRGDFEGWSFYAGKPAKFLPRYIGRLCIVETRGCRRLLAYLSRGKRSTVNLKPFREGCDGLEGVDLKWIAPVLWIRTKR